MNLTVRSYGYTIILIYLIIHVANLIVVEVHSTGIDDLLFRAVSSNIYLGIDVVSIISVGVLLYGLFTFSKHVVLGWFVYTVILWHFQFALIIVNAVLVNAKGYTSANYFNGTLIPSLQLCIWALIEIYVFRYWCMLKEFEQLPDYLRTEIRLLELSHHRYETDRLRKKILAKRHIFTYHHRI